MVQTENWIVIKNKQIQNLNEALGNITSDINELRITNSNLEEEISIVQNRVASLGKVLELPDSPPAIEQIRRVVTVFRELRSGVTEDKKAQLKMPSGTLSTAEAISVMSNGWALASHFGDGLMKFTDANSSAALEKIKTSGDWNEEIEVGLANLITDYKNSVPYVNIGRKR